MRDYFRGWGRRVGCVTLVMACGLLGIWVRSYAVYDFIDIVASDRLNRITSCHGKIGLAVWDDSGGMPPFGWVCVRAVVVNAIEPDAHAAYLGLVRDGDNSYLASYWQATAPLTLLSAYLILWKPRKRN
jgi:hypothetical protein